MQEQKRKRDCTGPNLIENLVLSFFSGFDFVKDEENIFLTWDEQKQFIDMTIRHPLVEKYPMNRNYCKTFLKSIMKKLEKSNEYVHDDLYNGYCKFIQDDSKIENCYDFKHYLVQDSSNSFITVKENANLIIHGTTGLRTWEAAIVLADWAMSNKNHFQNKNVLELGSGLGMTGMAVAKYCGTSSYCFSDCHPRVLSLLEENIVINFPDLVKHIISEKFIQYNSIENGLSLSIMDLDWNNASNIFLQKIPDVVIGADIVYDPSTFIPLCNLFDVAFDLNKNLKIFIVCTVRNEETTQGFIKELHKKKFSNRMLTFENPLHIYWDKDKRYYIMEINKDVY